MFVHVPGLRYMLVVPDLAIFGGFVPQVATVSLVQYRAAGVPLESLAAWLPEFALDSRLERCWIYTSLGVLIQLVSIEFEFVYPWFLALLWHVMQPVHFFGKALVRFRSPVWIPSHSLHC